MKTEELQNKSYEELVQLQQEGRAPEPFLLGMKSTP